MDCRVVLVLAVMKNARENKEEADIKAGQIII